jgi:hypothetical protein
MTVQYPTVWRIIAYLYSLIINTIKYSLINSKVKQSYIQLEGSYMTKPEGTGGMEAPMELTDI